MSQIIQEKSLLVSAIDEVYPELKLGERLNKAQYAMSPTLPLPPPRAVWPGVREPAHMMRLSGPAVHASTLETGHGGDRSGAGKIWTVS